MFASLRRHTPRRALAWHLIAALAAYAELFPARAAHADELLLLGGRTIKGVVVREAPQGVWFETAPYTAILFSYDKVIRATKWDNARNEALMRRSRVSVPTDPLPGEVVHRTSEGSWVKVQPRIARFVKGYGRSQPASESKDDASRALTAEREAELVKLAQQFEPITKSQLSHLAGPPHDRERSESGGQIWRYFMSDGRTATATFNARGVLEDLFIRS